MIRGNIAICHSHVTVDLDTYSNICSFDQPTRSWWQTRCIVYFILRYKRQKTDSWESSCNKLNRSNWMLHFASSRNCKTIYILIYLSHKHFRNEKYKNPIYCVINSQVSAKSPTESIILFLTVTIRVSDLQILRSSVRLSLASSKNYSFCNSTIFRLNFLELSIIVRTKQRRVRIFQKFLNFAAVCVLNPSCEFRLSAGIDEQ